MNTISANLWAGVAGILFDIAFQVQGGGVVDTAFQARGGGVVDNDSKPAKWAGPRRVRPQRSKLICILVRLCFDMLHWSKKKH